MMEHVDHMNTQREPTEASTLFSADELADLDLRSRPKEHPFGELLQHHGVVMPPSEAAQLFHALYTSTPWQRRTMMLHGKEVEMPRDIAWYGVSRGQGVYGQDPQEWPPLLLKAKELVERLSGFVYNGCLCNLYRDGSNAVAWHSDREARAGAVASLSLGATRVFRVRSKSDHSQVVDIPLPAGTLLVMRPGCQEATEHTVPRTKQVVGARINLTFRQVAEG